MSREKSFHLLRTIAAMIIAMLAAFAVIVLVSDSPLEAIRLFVLGPVSKERYIGNVINAAIPLIFSGLSMAVVFQASQFNMGAEGIFYFSGAVISMIAIWVPLPSGIHQFVIIAAGAAVGALIMLIPGFLKAKYGSSELVTSLMMNSILLGLGSYLMFKVLQDPMASNGSYPYADTAKIPIIFPKMKVHAGIIIALVCVVFVYLFLYKTKWGYEIRMVGKNQKFAAYSGINIVKVIIIAHIVAGILAGMGGSVECISMHKRFEWTSLPGYGFNGALIAMLANNNPVNVIFAALFVAYLTTGADIVSRMSDVPTEISIILQSLIILLMASERFLHSFKQRWIERGIEK